MVGGAALSELQASMSTTRDWDIIRYTSPSSRSDRITKMQNAESALLSLIFTGISDTSNMVRSALFVP
jgi:hypothetical protein